jgi:hypothetical protein
MKVSEVSISVVKCSWVKCGEVLQCSDCPSNKVSNRIRWHIDSMKGQLIYCLGSIFYQCIYGCIPVKYCNLCVFIFMSVYSYCMFNDLHHASWHACATLTEVFQCFFLSCKANARVKSTKMWHGLHQTSNIFCVVLCIVCFVSLCILFVCKCVQHYCHRGLPNCS